MKHTLQYFSFLVITLLLCNCETESTLSKYTKEKILVVGNSTEPAGLDPHVVTGVIESNVLRALFEGLCLEDPLDEKIHRPGGAVSWTHNEDFTEWIFNLQPEGKWSDGVDITTEDYVFAYHRILSPDFGGPYSSMLYYLVGAEDYNKRHNDKYIIENNPEFAGRWQDLKSVNYRGGEEAEKSVFSQDDFNKLSKDEKIKLTKAFGLNNLEKSILEALKNDNSLFTWPDNVDKTTQNAILTAYIANHGKDFWDQAKVGVTAVDKHTLKINLRSSVPFLPDLMKHYTWFAVPKHVVLEHGTISQQNTKWTDPENIVSNGAFKMKSWKFNYKVELDRNPHYWDYDTVKLNGIIFLPIINTYTEARMFFNDQIHVTYTLAPELVGYSKENHPENLRQETYLNSNFLRFNQEHEALKDLNLRKAISYATDAEALINFVYKGGELLATGVVPPMSNYEPHKKFGFDPAKAKKYFAKTKYAKNPGDLKIRLLTTDREPAKTSAEALQAMWKEHLGIEVQIEQREWASYQTSMSELDYGICTGGWTGDFPDATTFLDMWKKGDGNNRTGWSSVKYEAKLHEAEKSTDPLARLKILQEAEAIFMADFPIIPILHSNSNYLTHKSLKNWNPMITKSQPFKFVDLQN